MGGRAAGLCGLVGAVVFGAACAEESVCSAESGSYRVEWLEVPSDCRPIERLERVQLDFDGSCAAVDDRGACGIELGGRPGSCAFSFEGGFATFRTSDLLVRDGDRWKGAINAIQIADVLRDLDLLAGVGGRPCNGTGRVVLTYDADYEPPPVPRLPVSSYDDCTDGGVCAEGEECTASWFFEGYSHCEIPSVEPPRPSLGEPCIAACDEGVCVYPDGKPSGELGRCEEVPAIGEPCGISVDPWLPPQCADGYCDETNVCLRVPTPGEPCTYRGVCAEGYCDDAGFCRFHPVAGEPCEELVDCGFHCDPCWRQPCCRGGYCELGAPDGPTCAELRGPGELCRRSWIEDVCEPGSLCTCESIDAGLECEVGVCR